MKNKKSSNAILIILAILVLIGAGVFIYKYLNMPEIVVPDETIEVSAEEEKDVLVVPEKKVQIYNK